jgi:hypothetical protein
VATAKPLHLRAFVEGIEVPVVAAQVSINLNGPAAASIQIVPLDEGRRFHYGTMVHLFFLDQYQNKALMGVKSDWYNKDLRLSAEFLKNYRLLFSGHYVGFSTFKQPNQRALILQCLDFSSLWDSAHATAMEFGPHGNAFTNTSSLYGSDASIFDDIVNFQAEMLVSWLRQRPLTPGLTNVSGLAGGIIRMMEAMGGVPSHHKGVNDFFTIQELRCRLMAQITAEENDNTASRILSAKVFDEWLRNGLQNMGQQVTFRSMMNLLMQYIYYDTVPNPAAKYEPVVQGTTSAGLKRTLRLSSTGTAQRTITRLELLRKTVDRLGGFSNPDAVRNDARESAQEVEKILTELKTLGQTTRVAVKSLQVVQSTLSQALLILQRIASSGAAGGNGEAALKLFDTALNTLRNSEDVVVEQTSRGKTTTASARLRSQIIRPDCWFVPPPRCNVIFPEQYLNLSYERSLMGEVTRNLVIAYNTLVGQDALLSDKILAPNIGRDIRMVAGKSNASGYRALMPHELHTGIIPRTEWLPNTSSAVRSANEKATVDVRGARNTWASRVALFHFFKYRFAPRQASLSGSFNPYVVAGFPAVVLSRPFIVNDHTLQKVLGRSVTDRTDQDVLDAVQGRAQELGGPSHLIGLVIGLNHNLDQSGGTTSITLNHVREHLGVDDEFVGVFSERKELQKKHIRFALKFEQAQNDPKLLRVLVGVTPQSSTSKEAVSQKKVSRKNVEVSRKRVDPRARKLQEEKVSRTYGTFQEAPGEDSTTRTTRGRIEGLEREVDIPLPPGKLKFGMKGVFGTLLGIEVVNAGLRQTASGHAFDTVILHEQVEIGEMVALPIEEIIRPSWFSPSYTNTNIGQKIYEPFFGTGSIIDELDVTGLGENTISLSDSPEGIEVTTDQKIEDIVAALRAKEKVRSKASIERAVNMIGYTYGLVKARGLDVDDFIRSYSQRPIATLVDLLGSPDLALGTDAQGKVTVTQGTLGFHSLALHPELVKKGNLAGLLEDPAVRVPRINGQGKREPIPPQYDVRHEKRDRVLAYIEALGRGPAFPG